jgi:hypothetical protein
MPVTFVIMKELTLEKNPVDVNNVGRFLLKPILFEFMKKLTLKKFYGCNKCGKFFTHVCFLQYHERTHLEENPMDVSNI